MKRITLFLFLFFLVSGTALAASGYKIYTGASSRTYNVSITDVGLVQSGTVLGLTPGQVYYFAVTAYIDSRESVYSDEVFGTVIDPGEVGLAWYVSPDVLIPRNNMFFFNF